MFSMWSSSSKISLRSKFSYVFFYNPTHKTKIGTTNKWETSNRKPLGPIIMIRQSKTRNSSQTMYIIIFSKRCPNSLCHLLTLAKWVRVNQPPWLHQSVVLFVGWARWFASLLYVNQHFNTINFFKLLTFDHLFFRCHFFPNHDLHTTHPPSYPIDINLNLLYELTVNPLFTLANFLFPIG
jgi:hypothetical protein